LLGFGALPPRLRDFHPLERPSFWSIFTIQGTHSTYPKGGVSCSADTFVQAESSVLRMKFSGKIPALRVAANRYREAYLTKQTFRKTLTNKNRRRIRKY
jgi:hypothetical protein